jgi:hypothetical protein
MKRERALKIVLVVVGLLFCAAVYPLILMVKQDPGLAMMMSFYGTLGIFLLLAARNPSANGSLIAFTAWSSFAHAAVMSFQAFRNLIAHGELIGSAVLVVIGVTLLTPRKGLKRRPFLGLHPGFAVPPSVSANRNSSADMRTRSG